MTKPPSLDVVSVASVEQKDVKWLWEPYLPLSKLTLLEGDPEVGKTFVALALAAAITRGQPLGFGIPVEDPSTGGSEPGNVLYISAEDDVADTLKPRFLRQGGDESRFFAAQPAVASNRQSARFTLADSDEFERIAAQTSPSLVVIDPLQAFLGSNVDMHRANEVRPVLATAARVAERHGFSMMIVRHLNKSSQQKGMYRGQGSIDIAAAARSILLAGAHPSRDGFALTHAKSSLAAKGPALTYRITNLGLTWTGTDDLRSDDLLGIGQPAVRQPRSRAVEFLRLMLAAGPRPAREVSDKANHNGISLRTLARARAEIGIETKPSGYQGEWLWCLPSELQL